MNLTPSDSAASLQPSSQRKRNLLDHFEANGDELDSWREFNAAYHEDDRKFMQFLIPPGKRVLELGCGRGDLLAALKPSYGVGIDFGVKTIAKARALHPGLHFVLGDVEAPQTLAAIEGPFDYIVIADTIGMFEDIDGTLKLVHRLCTPPTRIIISYYSHLWEPILKIAEALNLRSKQPKINYIATADFLNLMDLADFEVIRDEQRQLLPRRWLGLGPFINRFVAPLPGIPADLPRRACDPEISGSQTFSKHRRSLPERKRQYRECDSTDAKVRRSAGDSVCRGKFRRRHISGMRTGSRYL